MAITTDTVAVLEACRPYLDKEERFVSAEIGRQVGISQALVCWHLTMLIDAGYLQRKEIGWYIWDRKPTAPLIGVRKRQRLHKSGPKGPRGNKDNEPSRAQSAPTHKADQLIPMNRLMAGNGRIAKLRKIAN